MPNAANRPPESRFMGLFVGPSKSGKTVAECSFPGPILVFDFDGRIGGIDGAPWIDKTQVDYQYYPPRVGPNTAPTYEKVNNDFAILLAESLAGRCRYKTVIVDSLTSLTFALTCDSSALTHAPDRKGEVKGKFIGKQAMLGPEDYGFEAQGTYNVLAYLRSLPIPNIIVSAHVVDKYGKIPDANGNIDKYSERVIIGERLSLRDKIAENTGIYFDHCFRFDKEYYGREKYTVACRSVIASTSYADLPDGPIDITGKSFYKVMMDYLAAGRRAATATEQEKEPTK